MTIDTGYMPCRPKEHTSTKHQSEKRQSPFALGRGDTFGGTADPIAACEDLERLRESLANAVSPYSIVLRKIFFSVALCSG